MSTTVFENCAATGVTWKMLANAIRAAALASWQNDFILIVVIDIDVNPDLQALQI
jgi:hypothetical protein